MSKPAKPAEVPAATKVAPEPAPEPVETAAPETAAREVAAPPTHEGFTVGLALVDALPVLFFCVGMLVLAGRVASPLFLIGAIAMTVGGTSKVLWKLLLGLGRGSNETLKKLFRPCMFGGLLLLVAGLIFTTAKGTLNWANVGAAIIAMPQVICFALALAGMVAMGVLAAKLDQTKARSNWIEQLTNTFAQLALLVGILLAA